MVERQYFKMRLVVGEPLWAKLACPKQYGPCVLELIYKATSSARIPFPFIPYPHHLAAAVNPIVHLLRCLLLLIVFFRPW